jgi:DNA-binding CsgD family transcriptional regulator
VTFHRRKPFTEDEHYLLSLLQTHLADAVQSKDSLPAAQAAHGWQLRVRSDGTSEPVDDELAQLLARYFPSTAGSRALPRELVGWVRRQLTHPGRAEPPAVSGPEWIIAQPGGRLLLRLANSGPYRVLHVREERGAADFFRLKGRGLTPRECEVAFWVGQGRRDAEIARLLGCAVKTASKHMENLLAKTGAETRAGATHAVQEWLRAPA